MAVPKAAIDYYNKLDKLGASANLAGRKAWQQVDRDHIRDSWALASRELSVAITSAQVEAATLGASYGADTIAAQGFYTPPDDWVVPQAFAGMSPNGFPVEAALQSPAPRALRQISQGVPVDDAMRSALVVAGAIAQTMVIEASRSAAGVDTFVRQGVGYTRMVNPGACDRCLILAGKFYRNNAGFLRHPNCACIHVPTSQQAARDEGLIDDPYELFNSLSEAEQDARFTKAGAQAIRDGADIYQVVNARAGMSYAGVSVDGTFRGQRATGITTAGSTSRAHTGGIENRLTPDAIYQRGLPREQTLELLREQGYVFDAGQVPGGSIRGPDYEGFGALGRGGRAVGIRHQIEEARRTGMRDPNERATMTAAELRLDTARLRYEAVLDGRNPYGTGPLTPDIAAQVENDFRRWLNTGGEIFVR
jgi:hypothetical protein